MAFSQGVVVVGEVGTGEESLRAVLELDPDLVVMDIRLPGIDGFEAAPGASCLSGGRPWC